MGYAYFLDTADRSQIEFLLYKIASFVSSNIARYSTTLAPCAYTRSTGSVPLARIITHFSSPSTNFQPSRSSTRWML